MIAHMMGEAQSRVTVVRSDEGPVEPRALEDCLRRLEKTFDGIKYPPERNILLAIFLLDEELVSTPAEKCYSFLRGLRDSLKQPLVPFYVFDFFELGGESSSNKE
ncbi:hypothetical protein IEQ34_013949 [Dendrobium chrysotoxum]|uniref:Uncharacterized protein n=1 Tax=Dendrobium chrysotoxum TaxID=161865 RepID=A0AAV7GIJ1_DENCH|nr:hypothetical protein IEQ34_013949 [Dendrobium chrysotoxum]